MIPLHDESTTDGLVLAWAHGGSLDALCARPDAKPFPRERVIAIVRALLGACVCLHERGIVHRDIKPSNILLDGPQIWLADFGVAATNTPSGRWESLPAPWREMEVGTIGWVAPELRANPQDISPKNDVYSVGRLWEWVFARSDSDERTDLPLQKSMTDPDPAARPTAADVLRRL